MSHHDGEPVRAAQLLQHPLDYNGRRITAQGRFTYGFEHSNFAGAWVDPPPGWCEHHPEWDRPQGYTAWVRITGRWRANPPDQHRRGGFGHFGLYTRSLVAERIDEVPPHALTTVGPGELRARLEALEGELVEASLPVVIGHELCTFDDFPDRSALLCGVRARRGRDPTEQPARLLLWIERQSPVILRCEWLGETRALPVPRVAAAELPAYVGHIVDVEGALEIGEYWPRLGPLELVPPEITTTERAYHAYGRSSPPPPEIERWHRLIADRGGALPVAVRGTVLDGGKKLSAYRLQQLAAP